MSQANLLKGRDHREQRWLLPAGPQLTPKAWLKSAQTAQVSKIHPVDPQDSGKKCLLFYANVVSCNDYGIWEELGELHKRTGRTESII